MNQLSKDQIKDRLLKRAAKQWGYNDVELENVFDPIVNLLFDVCAKELEKISNEIFSSRRRMTERLVDILTPTSATKATPARGILRAYPVENESVLNEHHQFFLQKKEINPYNPIENIIKNYHFGPTIPVKLNRNKLNYVVLPSGVQNIEKNQFREFVSEKNFTNKTPHGTIWLGLKHEGDGIMRDLMFYFYLKNIHERNKFFHFLPRAKWSLNNIPLTISKGYNNDDETKKVKYDLKQHDIYHIKKIEEHTNDFYFKNFITINESITIDESHYEFPSEFEEFIPSKELEKMKEDKSLIWLKIEFPNVIGPDILSDIFCSNNCFPVINKKLNETQGNIKELLDIYPLKLNDDYFLELFSVMNDRNKNFDVITNNDEPEDENYAYLRFGGVARFDERNAAEEINYLIDLIRDEAAAFSRLGHDFTDNNLKEINQIIARFKTKMNQTGMQNLNNPYLVLNTKKTKEKGTLFIKYWTTNGNDANKISTFTKFSVYKGSDFEKDNIMLLSSTQGGRNELTNSEKIYAYRENLISNQRVVTRQDIIILCKNHFGEAVEDIEVVNGIQTGLDSTIGYTPTIDILLTQTNKEYYTDEEWHFLSEDLKLMIEKRALNIVPFRIVYR
ncbi:hypothetical protein [uncultured Flavobacterium sp.]|uniref:hypothetical protein n=1 Tax=uncultured Flavobacterium sp. TaxID=165435 RepID=UPI0030EBB75E|tara:strand:- start:9902 stop:11755 length:1854 start_codon:yes stop_codon:yes gene_type:complete